MAIGETIIKIAGRCIVKTSRQKINAKLMSGFQLGEGVPAGLEASTHSVLEIPYGLLYVKCGLLSKEL